MTDQNRKYGIVFASAEAAPFVKTGGLGDVAGSLPQALVKEGADVVVMVPKYATIAAEYRDKMEHIAEFYVPLGWRNEYCGLDKLERDGVTYLFLDNEGYFGRSCPYGFFDDGERFAFFSKAIVESLQFLPSHLNGFTCDVLHCNDWHTALAPVFLREFYRGIPLYDNVRTVFSIHNIAFQGQFTSKILNDILGLAHIPAAAFQLTCGPDAINYMQGALNYSDAITTVSPTYAAEIQTPEFGEHLDGVLRRRSNVLQGILNGIDTESYDPAADKAIAKNYGASDLSGKAACKKALQGELGLEVRDDRPLMVMVTRLTRQKGLDLVTYALDRICSGGVQVAVLGTGDCEYENALRYFEGKYPGTFAARIEFDPALSRRMYAGADLFAMPSLFEPCGLSQIIAMRYGALPVVRETGGLKDTVQPYNQYTGEGTGFTFTHFNGDEFGDAVFRAARLFWDDRAAFDKLVGNAMSRDFSWKQSACHYADLYRVLHPEVPLVSDEVIEAREKAEKEAAAKRAAEEKAAKEAAAKAKAEAEAAAKAKAEAEAAAKAKAEKEAAAKRAAEEKAAKEAAAKAKAVAEAEAKKKAEAEAAAKKKAEAEAAAKAKAEKEAAAKKAKAEAEAAAKKAAEEKAAAEAAAAKKAEPAAKAPAAKTTASRTTASRTTAAKTTASKAAPKSTASKAAAAKPAESKTAAKATAKATTSKPSTASKPAHAARAAAKPASAKTTTAKSAAAAKPATKTTAAKPAPAKAAAAKAKPAAKPAPAKAAAAKTAPSKPAPAKTMTAKPATPAAPEPVEKEPAPKAKTVRASRATKHTTTRKRS